MLGLGAELAGTQPTAPPAPACPARRTAPLLQRPSWWHCALQGSASRQARHAVLRLEAQRRQCSLPSLLPQTQTLDTSKTQDAGLASLRSLHVARFIAYNPFTTRALTLLGNLLLYTERIVVVLVEGRPHGACKSAQRVHEVVVPAGLARAPGPPCKGKPRPSSTPSNSPASCKRACSSLRQVRAIHRQRAPDTSSRMTRLSFLRLASSAVSPESRPTAAWSTADVRAGSVAPLASASQGPCLAILNGISVGRNSPHKHCAASVAQRSTA